MRALHFLGAHPDFDSALLGLRLFRIERDVHGDFIAHGRHELGDAEVRTLDDGRRVETRCLDLDHSRDFEDACLVDLGIERHRLGYSMRGEVAGYSETALPSLFNFGALERDRRIVGGVEEIWAFQLFVEFRDPRVQPFQRQGDRNRRLGQIGLVEQQAAFDLVEARGRIGEAEMVPAKNDSTVPDTQK